MEKGKKNSICANFPIEDAYMAAITTRLIRATQAFPIDHEVWYKLTITAHTRKA